MLPPKKAQKINLQNLQQELQSKLTGFSKLAILGVGSELRGDDVVGLLTTQLIGRNIQNHPHVKTILASTAPENFTGEIRQFAPSHLLVIDAAELQKEPGSVELVPLPKVVGSASSTHALPLSIMLHYLQQDMDLTILLLGIQPAQTIVGAAVSSEVKKAARDLAKMIGEMVGRRNE